MPSRFRSWPALAALLVLSGGQVLAQQQAPQSQLQQRWQGWQRQRAEALTKLSPQQRRDYVKAQRDLEQRFHNQRLTLLDQSGTCLEQALGQVAVERCLERLQSGRMQLRREEMTQLQQLLPRR
jgi:GrpB-like predicted nucleotidyltransferase (UPF0157 family)